MREEEKESAEKKEPDLLLWRNIFAAAFGVLMTLSFLLRGAMHPLRSAAYIFGAGAYLFEVVEDLKMYHRHPPLKVAFMEAIFFVLYLALAIDYFVEYIG